MRIAGLVFGFIATLSVTAAALAYVPAYVGQHRIYVQDSLSPQDQRPYHEYGYSGNTTPDSGRTATGKPDPYHQRYYSQTEGWTYYTLPLDSSARRSGDR
jgi:hypothetical protein